MNKKIYRTIILACILLSSAGRSGYLRAETPSAGLDPAPSAKATDPVPEHYKPYLEFLSDVYKVFDDNYYKPVSRAHYEQYIEKYKKSVLAKLPPSPKRVDRVAYIGAGLMINQLKDPKDHFTNFIPPKEAKEYSQQIYGYEYGIGVEGHPVSDGYLIDHVQIRSNAYAQGIRAGALVLTIDGKKTAGMTEKELKDLLYPPLKTVVTLKIRPAKTKKTLEYRITCEEYFIETVRDIPTHEQGIYCLKLSQFNQKTNDDFKNYMRDFLKKPIRLLIVDLTDNPGGPPLAVQELSGIFLPERAHLFYYQKKNVPQFGLTVPASDLHYTGPLVILINKMSGSSSELTAGAFQAHKRAIVAGKEPSAGFTFLKTGHKFDDGSMLAMITGIAYLFNGVELDYKGVQPQISIPADVNDSVQYIVKKFRSGEIPHDSAASK